MTTIVVSGDTLGRLKNIASKKAGSIRDKLNIEDFKGVTSDNVIEFLLQVASAYYHETF